MATADHVDISALLKGKHPVGSRVTVRGWVRTRRDSKAGLSFVHVHDGTCFDPIQVVAPAELSNYQSEVVKLTSGCAVIATGTFCRFSSRRRAVTTICSMPLTSAPASAATAGPDTGRLHAATAAKARRIAALEV